MSKTAAFAVPPRSKSMARVSKRNHHLNKAIGGKIHGGDAGYWHMSHLKNF
jgi:hypothetical protein